LVGLEDDMDDEEETEEEEVEDKEDRGGWVLVGVVVVL